MIENRSVIAGGLITKGQEGVIWNDRNILYLARGGGYMGTDIYQNSKVKCSSLLS